jgi:hypothetical protein
MLDEVREPWTARLRSGQDEQGTNFLHRETGEKCCLGVLCAQAVEAGVIPPPILVETRIQGVRAWAYGDQYERSYEVLPRAVRVWAGLTSSNPTVTFNDHDESLANMNDDGFEFPQIADVIDANPDLS